MSEFSSNRPALTLHYWKIPGRASLAYLLMKSSGLPVTYIDEDEVEVKQSYKQKATFGQLPFLTDDINNVALSQSAAIATYAARISGLDGLDVGRGLREWSKTLEYIELDAELMQFCGKALYTGEDGSKERADAWATAKLKVTEKLALVVRNLGQNTFLCGSKPLAADFAVANLLWFLSSASLWGQELKQQFPKLNEHFDALVKACPEAQKVFAEMDNWPAYYKI